MQMLFLANEAEVAHRSGGIADLFVALGINWQALALNAAAFLVLAWLLGKFVYPHLIKAIDARLSEAEATVKARQEAEVQLNQASDKAAKLLTDARRAAGEIADLAKEDAVRMVKEAETKAAKQAERIKDEAREQLSRDVEAARRTLKADTLKLVATATETVLQQKLDDGGDAKLVKRSVEGQAV